MPTSSTPERQAARAAGLRYVDDTQPGISRRRAGKGFAYRDADGHAVRDATTLPPGTEIETRLATGTIHSIIK